MVEEIDDVDGEEWKDVPSNEFEAPNEPMGESLKEDGTIDGRPGPVPLNERVETGMLGEVVEAVTLGKRLEPVAADGVGPVIEEPKGVKPSGPKPKGKSEVASNAQASLEDSDADEDPVVEDCDADDVTEDAVEEEADVVEPDCDVLDWDGCDWDGSDWDGSGFVGSGLLGSGFGFGLFGSGWLGLFGSGLGFGLFGSGLFGSGWLGLLGSGDGAFGSGICSPSVTGAPELPGGQMTHGSLNLGSLGNLRNSNETSGNSGRFQSTNPLPTPPQFLYPTITGRIKELLLPREVIVIKVLLV